MSRFRPNTFLLASDTEHILTDLRSVLESIHVAECAERPTFPSEAFRTTNTAAATVDALASASVDLLLLDATLPDFDPAKFFTALPENPPLIVLLATNPAPEVLALLESGAINDILTLHAHPIYWRLRIQAILRSRQEASQLQQLREAATARAHTDPLTGSLNRPALLSLLFRETDRSQRMSTSLSMILLDIDDFAHWKNRLGSIVCDDLLLQVTSRVRRLLRSYDIIGRLATEKFAVVLPGCDLTNAALLTERMRVEVFAAPFRAAGRSLRLTACFGVAVSKGRSPVVVLREAENALETAQSAGPETIQCSGSRFPSRAMPEAVHIPDDPLAW